MDERKTKQKGPARISQQTLLFAVRTSDKLAGSSNQTEINKLNFTFLHVSETWSVRFDVDLPAFQFAVFVNQLCKLVTSIFFSE